MIITKTQIISVIALVLIVILAVYFGKNLHPVREAATSTDIANSDASAASQAADKAATSARKAADSTKKTADNAEKAAKDASKSAKDASESANKPRQ